MRGRRLALLSVALVACAGAAAAAETPSSEISPAERMVFLDAHLARTRPPVMLRYSLEETAPAAAPPAAGGQAAPLPPVKPGDQLRLDLKAKADGGCCAVAATEVGGEAFGFLPPVEEAKANPVVLYFLERDIRRMSAATGGQTNYFRRLIRLALADHAAVRDTTVRYGGRDVAAHEVRVSPYVDDPRRPLLGPLADKAYSFVLADEVPGGVYQIRTVTPAPATGAGPAAETVLTLAEASVAAADGPSVQERSQ